MRQVDFKETGYEHMSVDGYGTFFTSEKKWINKLHKLKKQHPDLVDIRFINPDGSLVARIPKTWFKISPPRKINLTEQQVNERVERLSSARKVNADKKG